MHGDDGEKGDTLQTERASGRGQLGGGTEHDADSRKSWTEATQRANGREVSRAPDVRVDAALDWSGMTDS